MKLRGQGSSAGTKRHRSFLSAQVPALGKGLVRTQREGHQLQARKMVLTRARPREHPDLRLLASRTARSKCLSCKPHSRWYFVKTGQAKARALQISENLCHSQNNSVMLSSFCKEIDSRRLGDQHELAKGQRQDRNSDLLTWSFPFLFSWGYLV